MREFEDSGRSAGWAARRWLHPAELAVQDNAAAAVVPGVHLRLLALPALLLAGRAPIALERKDAALLALLVVDGPTPRARAAALLWPDADTRKARNNLRQRLFRLRRATGVDVVEERAALSLAPAVDHDLAALPARLAQDPAAASGELLGTHAYEDCDELDQWVKGARERFRTQRRDAVAAALAAEERDGRIARALVFAERLVGEDALSEQAHRLLMRLHYRRGDRSAALAAYVRCQQALQRELGAQPGAETRELAQLIERSGELPGTAPRLIPTAIARPPLLIGRDGQWRALDDAWEQGRVALLSGDAGMGKSRLLGDFAQRRGALLCGAQPGDARVPYALLARLLRAALATAPAGADPAVREELARVLPELGAAPASPMNEARFRQAVLHMLDACRMAGLSGVALDDLHYADEASLEMLPSLNAGGLKFALAVRDAEAPAPLAAWRRNEMGAALAGIGLPPLAEADVRALIDSLELEGIDAAHLAPIIARHTGGNPYYVLETLRAVVAQPDGFRDRLPTAPTVGALIERRLAQLGPDAQRLARVAALAGADFSAALAAHVLDAHPLDLTEGWTELVHAHVLRGDGFAHDLVRDVAAHSVPRPIAELLHRGIAQYLEGAGVAPARVAYHYAEAGLWQQAADFHLQAADEAQRASRRVEEVAQREAAVACLDRVGAADAAFEARRASIESLILVRGVEHAHRFIDGMLATARGDAQKAAALTARAMASLMAADHANGVACAREALVLAEGLDQFWLRFEAARLLAVGLSQQAELEAAEAVLSPYEEQVQTEGTAEQRGHYWADMAYVLNSARRLRRTADALARAIDCARELGDLAELATLTTNLATVHGNLGHVGQAYEHALRARALQVELGDMGGPMHGVIEAHVGLYGSGMGQYGTALEAYDNALASFRRDAQVVWIAVSSNNLAMTLMDLGQLARARKTLEYVTPAVSHVVARGALLAARLSRLLGASGAAELQRAADALAHGPDFYVGALLDLERSESLPPAGALVLCDATVHAAEQREFGGIATKARLLAARAALAAGAPADALARWNELEPTLDTLQPADGYPPLAGLTGHQILQANGVHERAHDALAQALHWVRQTALPQVPEAFRDSFLNRNPVNRALLLAESRSRVTPR